MENQKAFKIVIVGGGTAGYMASALLTRLGHKNFEICLVESDEISTIGVGEATIPAIKTFNQILSIDETEFIKATQGTFKLGIKFQDWYKKGEAYIHGFGKIGRDWDFLRMHQYWLKYHLQGEYPNFGDFSINTVAPDAYKFMRSDPKMKESPLSEIAYAFHFDAGLYAKFLRAYSEARGLKRIEGKVVKVNQNSENGFITSIDLEHGLNIEGDLFIDCTGFRGLLIEQTLKTGYEDWGRWLKVDRAIAVPCNSKGDMPPYTLSTALSSGWRWKIPLQHRTGNGHVYSSKYIDDNEAEQILLDGLEGEARANPLKLRFTLGKRKQLWNKNCVAIGLSGGFLEPLESTGLYMIQSAVVRLIRLFPDKGFDQANIDEFNRQASFEFERIRDFIILHYKATERDDSEFWRDVKALEIPDSLQNKIDVFAANGRIFRENDELFAEESWIQVFLGQGIIPKSYDPMVDIKTDNEVREYLNNAQKVIKKCVDFMPTQKDFIEKYCKAPKI